MSRPAFIERATRIYIALLPARDRVAAAEDRLHKLMAAAVKAGLDPREIDEAGFDAATKALAARARKGHPTGPPDLTGTPLGELLEEDAA